MSENRREKKAARRVAEALGRNYTVGLRLVRANPHLDVFSMTDEDIQRILGG